MDRPDWEIVGPSAAIGTGATGCGGVTVILEFSAQDAGNSQA